MPTSVPKKSQKLVTVLATSMLVTKDSIEAITVISKDLKQILCI